MRKHQSTEKMAEIIEEIYEKEFGGKKRGRFQISRSAFRRLAGRKRLYDSFINDVADKAMELGYVLIPIGDIIAVIEERVMLNYRNVPKSIILSYLNEEDGESDDFVEDSDDEE